MQETSCDMYRWASLHLSIAGKVNVLKTEYRYFMQTLLFEVLLSLFGMVNNRSYIFSFSGVYSFGIHLSLDAKVLTALMEKKGSQLDVRR